MKKNLIVVVKAAEGYAACSLALPGRWVKGVTPEEAEENMRRAVGFHAAGTSCSGESPEALSYAVYSGGQSEDFEEQSGVA